MKKIGNLLEKIFGYGITIVLFCGGLTFFGYLLALFIGGNIANSICTFIYKTVIPVIVYSTTILIIIGLFSMYMLKEKSLISNSKDSK